MLINKVITTTGCDDAELVRSTLSGNREAFGQIVARYQSLVCSLAYSATGSLGQSEDLAQETFVAAWKQLRGLREPEKLRAWLCGIARNLINNSLRKHGREPSHAAESIENISESHSPEPLPVDHTISNEEQVILWRSLEKIPETYREPLVLFYREHQSVEAVAEKLGLTPDTVHQRLSRGRKLLSEEVTAFVEGALSRTNPGQAFTIGVLAALPITLASSAKAATVAAAVKGGATATGSGFIPMVGGILSGPLLGFLFGFLAWREQLKFMRSSRERSLSKRLGLAVVIGGILFFIACSTYSAAVVPKLWNHHPVLALALGWVICLSWVIFVFTFTFRHNRKMTEVREEERQLHPELYRDELPPQAWEYRSQATLFGLPLVHWRSCGRIRRAGEKIPPAIGWIACGERAYGIIYASGGIAVGGVSCGGVSIGLLSLGGASIGLVSLGGFALGIIAIGGGAIGWVASGGLALGWHAALGGLVGAHDLGCGGAALGNHVNDALAKEFFTNHRWLNFSYATTRNMFWILCFGPMLVQMILWKWWRRKAEKRAKSI